MSVERRRLRDPATAGVRESDRGRHAVRAAVGPLLDTAAPASDGGLPATVSVADGRDARYPPNPTGLPEGTLEQGRYRLRFARRAEELDAVLRLRFRVFNVELGEGLAASWSSGRDEDPFDAACHHLLVEDMPSGDVVGTYRIQTSEMAAAGSGFYSAGEFDLAAMPPEVVRQAVEVGRACVDRAHRNRHVLFLLWRGLARYMASSGRRYLFGCCSLTSQDPREGWALDARLAAAGHLHPAIRVATVPASSCAAPQDDGTPEPEVDVPLLFRTYLRYGARVCSPPALDREFRTIDWLVLLDVQSLDARSHAQFFG